MLITEYIHWWNIVVHYLVIDSFRCHDPDWSSLVAAKDSSLLLWVEKLITSVSISGCAIAERWCKTSQHYFRSLKHVCYHVQSMCLESGCTICSIGKASDICRVSSKQLLHIIMGWYQIGSQYQLKENILLEHQYFGDTWLSQDSHEHCKWIIFVLSIKEIMRFEDVAFGSWKMGWAIFDICTITNVLINAKMICHH